MKMTWALLFSLLLPGFNLAKDRPPIQHCMILSMKDVPCGSQRKWHKKTRDMLCQEYLVQTDAMIYHVRQKDEKHSDLLQVGAPGEFYIDRDEMKLRVAPNPREFKFLVVEVDPR